MTRIIFYCIVDTTTNYLTCPPYPKNRIPIYDAEGTTFNVREHIMVSSTEETITITISPSEIIHLNHKDIGSPQVVEVTSTNKLGDQEKCRFHLETFGELS